MTVSLKFYPMFQVLQGTDTLGDDLQISNNGDMEGTYVSGIAPGWDVVSTGFPATKAEETSDIHGGASCQKLTWSSAIMSSSAILISYPTGGSSSFDVTAGNVYKVNFWVKVLSGTLPYVRVYNATTSKTYYLAINIIDRVWTNYQVYFTPSVTESLHLRVGGGAGSTCSFLFDDFTIKEVTATTDYVPLAGGRVHVYSAGTTTRTTVYADANLTVPHPNPIVLDSRGEARVFGTSTYYLVIKDADDSATLYTQDNVGLDRTPIIALTDEAGTDLAGGLLGTYSSGSSTERATYQDADKVTLNDNPIVADSEGIAYAYANIGSRMKYVLKDATQKLIWTVDDLLWGSAQQYIANQGGGVRSSGIVVPAAGLTKSVSGNLGLSGIAARLYNVTKYPIADVLITNWDSYGGYSTAWQPLAAIGDGDATYIKNDTDTGYCKVLIDDFSSEVPPGTYDVQVVFRSRRGPSNGYAQVSLYSGTSNIGTEIDARLPGSAYRYRAYTWESLSLSAADLADLRVWIRQKDNADAEIEISEVYVTISTPVVRSWHDCTSDAFWASASGFSWSGTAWETTQFISQLNVSGSAWEAGLRPIAGRFTWATCNVISAIIYADSVASIYSLFFSASTAPGQHTYIMIQSAGDLYALWFYNGNVGSTLSISEISLYY